jgi:hypothetical protein
MSAENAIRESLILGFEKPDFLLGKRVSQTMGNYLDARRLSNALVSVSDAV